MRIRWLFFLLCLSNYIVGQQYNFKQYTTQDGLISNSINDIIQSRDHRIWIATTGGLSSFNGRYFKNYNVSNGLSSNYINTVFEDSKGRIWVGTRGKGSSIIEDDVITNLGQKHPEGVKDVARFLEAKDGTIIIFSKDGILTYKDGIFSKINIESKSNTKIFYFDATWYDDNTIYIATFNYGIAKFTLNPAKIEFLDSNTHDFNDICYSVLKDGSKLWIGTYGEIVCLDPNKIIRKEKFDESYYDQNRVYDIFALNQDELLLAFEGNGFGVYNKMSKSYQIINQKNGLPTPYIYKAIKDYEGNIWLATDGHGLIKYKDFSFKLYNTNVGLNSNEITGVLPLKEEILVSSEGGLIKLKDNQVFELVNKPVYGISRSANKKALYATFDEIYELNDDNSSIFFKKGQYRHFYSDTMTSIFYKREFYEFQKGNNIKTFNHKNRDKYFLGIRPLKDRYILAHKNALLQYYKNEIKPINIENFEDSYFFGMDAYQDNTIVLGELNKHRLCVLTFSNDSIYKKDIPLNRFGLLENVNTLKVNHNNLWLGAQNVLVNIDLKNLIEEDSVVSKKYFFESEFFNASFKGDDQHNLEFTSDGTLVATSSDGLLMFDESKYRFNDAPPNIRLDNVFLFSEKLNDSLYRKKNIIELPYGSNYLTFKMEAITFTNPENVKFKYRLKGLREGNDWSEHTKDNSVVYSYLPPGDYVFEFTAENGNGIWQENSYSYPFKIKAPFWRLSWFWISLIFFTSLIIVITVVWRNKIQKEQLKRFSRDLIKAQEDERTRVSKDLHDSVGQQLTLIKKKAQNSNHEELSLLTNQALEEVRSISRALYPSNLKQLGLTESIEQLLYDLDEQNNLFFSVEIDSVNELFNEEQSLNIYRFIQEAINNVIKHARAKSVEVYLQRKDKFVRLTIKDDGQGFDNVAAIRKKSLGLKTMEERIRILDGDLQITSAENKGTNVEVYIPI